MIRNCPVCHIGKIVRKDIKTCGAQECLTIWRAMTVNQRAKAIENAADSTEITDLSKFVPSAPPSPTSTESPPHLSPSTQRDNEFLEKMFGPDAPGIVKEDKK